MFWSVPDPTVAHPTKKIYATKYNEPTLNPENEYIHKPFKKVEPPPPYNPIIGAVKSSPQKGKRIVKPEIINENIKMPSQKRVEAIEKNLYSNIFEKSENQKITGIPHKKSNAISKKVEAKDIINYKEGPKYAEEVGIQSKVNSAKISDYEKIKGDLANEYKAKKSAFEVNRMKNAHSNWQGLSQQ